MKIIELILENFEGVYVAMHTTFIRLDLRGSKNKICLITGPNGHGKTVLLSQLNPFASLGTLDERDALPLIMKDKNGHKKIIILDNGNEYEIDHFYTPTKTSHSVKSYIKKNGEELNPNGNVTSFKEMVKSELDMEQDYMKLVRLGNNVINMIDLKSAERKTFMSKRLEEVNIYLVYFKKINSELNAIKTMISMTMDKIKKTEIEDYDEAKDTLKLRKAELEALENAIIQVSDSIGQTTFQLSQIPLDAHEKMRESEKKLSKLMKTTDGSFETLESLKSKELALQTSIITGKEKKKILQDSLSMYLENIDEKRNEIDTTNAKISHLVAETDITGLEGIIQTLEIRVKNLEGKYTKYGEINYTKKDVEDVLSFLKEKQEALNSTYDFGIEPIKKVVDLMVKHKNVTDYISEHLKKVMEEEEIESGRSLITRLIKQFQPKIPKGCPGGCTLIELWSTLNSLSSTTRDKDRPDKEFYTYMSLAHTNIKNVMLSFTDKKDLFEKMPDYIKEVVRTDRLFEKIRSTEYIYDQKMFFEELAFMTEYENFLEDKNTLEEKKKELKTLLKSSPLPILQLHVKEAEKSLSEYLDKFSDTKEEIKTLEGRIRKDEATLEDVKSLIELVEKKEELEEIYKTSKAYVELKSFLLEDKFKQEALLSSYQHEKTRLQNTISSLSHNLKSLKQYKQELKVYQKFYDDWIMMKESLSSNTGIPLIFIDLYLKKAKSIVNALLDQIYNGKIFIENFDIGADSFTIPFNKEGKSISDIRYASQGEKSFFSIALSFAISFQSMSRYNIMLLDELDSVLDESNRSNFIAILERLIDMINAEQVFIISHNNMFSMYPVDVISVINQQPEDHKMANYIELLYN